MIQNIMFVHIILFSKTKQINALRNMTCSCIVCEVSLYIMKLRIHDGEYTLVSNGGIFATILHIFHNIVTGLYVNQLLRIRGEEQT